MWGKTFRSWVRMITPSVPHRFKTEARYSSLAMHFLAAGGLQRCGCKGPKHRMPFKTIERHSTSWRSIVDSAMNVPLCRRVLLHNLPPERLGRKDSENCFPFAICNLQIHFHLILFKRLLLDRGVFRGVSSHICWFDQLSQMANAVPRL